jgi:multidrug/hemolysin transport system permease protein
MKRSSIAGGYTVSAFLIGVIMSIITLILAEIYVAANGGALLSLSAVCKVLGLILLSTFANTSLVLFIVSFFKSSNAFATASTIIGTVIGFLTGIYLPIGQLPEGVQWIIKVFPVSHAAALFRQVMMADPISITFAGAPESAIDEFEQLMGVTFRFGETTVSPLASAAILILTAVVFFGLSILNLSRKRK